jgi:hypothetical protein
VSVCKAHLKNEELCRAAVKCYLSEERPIIQDVAKRFKLTQHTVQAMLKLVLSEKERERERALRLSRSKQGAKNPMKGKFGEKHPLFKGGVTDGKGYSLVLKPDWFTGRKGTKYVFEHHAVFCKAVGLTEIPEGFAIHHIDEDPMNNRIDNLALVTAGGHRRLHKASPWRKLSPWEKHVYGILK